MAGLESSGDGVAESIATGLQGVSNTIASVPFNASKAFDHAGPVRFRELGRVVRTMFLLKYINDAELRKTINAATNKSEEFNDFVKWLFFGGDGVIAENIRHEQRKVIKYNQLVANMVILHNVHSMSRILKRLQAKGYVLTEEILRGMAPYRRSHINRFVEYPLDLDKVADPLDYKINFSF